MEVVELEHSSVRINAHYREDCRGDVCPLHKRTSHSMRSWPQHWRGDRQLMERTCPHGIGHPDPDHLESLRVLVTTRYPDPDWWDRSVDEEIEDYIWGQGVHGCDSCCVPQVDTTYPTIAPVDLQVWPPEDDTVQPGSQNVGPCGGEWGDYCTCCR